MIEKITDQNLERYDSRLKEWCDRKFFEKGNYGKYQTTEEADAVAFYPAPNTSLEGKVKFSFKETMPVSGDKGPDNPSTIMGINSIMVTHCETEGIDSTDYTIQFGNTYYGGEIDLITGVMTVTWVKVVFGARTIDWVRSTTFQNATRFQFSRSLYPNKVSPSASACSHFDRIGLTVDAVGYGIYSISDGGFFNYPGTDVSIDTFNEFLATQYNAGTPVTVVYQLATPQTVQLTPIQIFSLVQTNKYTPRLNTVYTDADSIQISYLKSPIRDEYEKTQAILSLGGNS